MAENTVKSRLRDVLAVALFFPALPFLRFVGPRRTYLHAVRGLLDRAGVTVMANHYYEPSYTAADIFRDPDEPRKLAGIDWNLKGQLALLETFTYGPDLLALEGRSYRGRTFGYDNGWFGPGDAEALYAMIRHFKPRRIVEIGSGQSTLVARFAIADTTAVDPLYQCRQICFEPFENLWLDELGVEVRRERIERADPSLFWSLTAGDIVFIDSSHTQRPMGDVEFEFLHILHMPLTSLIFFVIWQPDPRGNPATSAGRKCPPRCQKIARERPKCAVFGTGVKRRHRNG